MKLAFDYENTWTPYRELALTPSVMIYLDATLPNYPGFYCIYVHFLAWKRGLKTLYYCRSEKLGKADRVSKRIEREVIKELDMTAIVNDETCIACEG